MLKEKREALDAIDDEIAELYSRRMAIVREIVECKKEECIPLNNKGREKEILCRITRDMKDDMKLYTKEVYETIFETSKAYQSGLLGNSSIVTDNIRLVLKDSQKTFPISGTVACQGVNGAYSSIAAEKLFTFPSITFFKSFDSIFNAVDKGLTEFGVLPIENSTAGSVDLVYDLMKKYRFHIVRSIKLFVDHKLLATKGAKIKEIREIYSHEQAINQCRNYISTLPNVKVNIVENTAIAAQLIQERNDPYIACISSRECSDLYNLEILKNDICDSDNNYTRFIVITKKLVIYSPSNRISLMVNLSNEAGSLNKLLSRFSALGLNLTKLESRPIGNSRFEVMFYFDFEADITREEVLSLIAELANTLPQFIYLGSFVEV